MADRLTRARLLLQGAHFEARTAAADAAIAAGAAPPPPRRARRPARVDEEEAEGGGAAASSPPINVKRRRPEAAASRPAVKPESSGSEEEEEEEEQAPGIPDGVTDAHLRRLAVEIEDRATASRELLGRIQNPPAQVHLDRMVRAVMRTMLFRAGRKPGAPVRRADLVAAVDASAAGVAGGRFHGSTALALTLAREAFARDFGLDLARIDLVPASGAARRGAGGGGGGGTSNEAFSLRTLLPSPAAAVAARAAGAGTRPPLAPGIGLLAAALVRLGGQAAPSGTAGGGGARGATVGAGGPGWMEEGELWGLLAQVGARKGGENDGPGALEAAWAGLNGRAGASPASQPDSRIIPGVGDPSVALKAALDGRWLVERWGPALEGNAGGRARGFGVGETALGGDGGAGLDAFIRLLFEAPDPAAELAGRGSGGAGGGRGRGG